MTRQAGLAIPARWMAASEAEACRMRGLIVVVLLLAGLTAHALLRWWPQLAG